MALREKSCQQLDVMKFDADIHMFFRMNSNDLGDPHSKYLPLHLKLHFVFSAD